MMPLDAVHGAVATRLAQAGLSDPRRAARLLLAEALAVPPDAVFRWPDRPVTAAEAEHIHAILARRLAGEPLSRIRGEREFWGLPFRLSAATLDPRPDSETLIETALRLYPDRQAPLAILDFGTGTGCLLLSLLMEYQQAWGLGIDLAPAAAETAFGNARQLGLGQRAAFLVADWDAALGNRESTPVETTAEKTPPAARFDLVISNPPYIPAADIAALDPEVRLHDPHLALDGGPDGLAAYRRIVPALRRRLRPGGWALLEIGVGQAISVPAFCVACGLLVTDVVSDLGGHPRIVIVKNSFSV